ncbi:MAG: ChrR family anti-sigma-E factor [Porticoccaceae bacterium]
MIKYHPNINTLTEYAAGSLGTATAIAVSAHMHFCHQCLRQVQNLQLVGGTILDRNIPAADVDSSVLDSLMQQLDDMERQPAKTSQSTTRQAKSDSGLFGLPPVVAKLIGAPNQLKWKKLTKSLQIARLATGQTEAEVSLHKITAGGKVLEHDHRGQEYTLVLKGSFSDENGIYQPGDFLLKQPGDVHKPYASANRDCICLTVVEAPVRFTGFWGKVLNPFLRLNPA